MCGCAALDAALTGTIPSLQLEGSSVEEHWKRAATGGAEACSEFNTFEPRLISVMSNLTASILLCFRLAARDLYTLDAQYYDDLFLIR